MDNWSGKRAIVTGANSGIGAAITKKLLTLGMKVVGLDKNVDFMEELKKEQGSDGKFRFYKTDFTNEEEILEAFQMIDDTVGAVHVLVNNAGLIGKNSLLNGTKQEWRNISKVNVLGQVLSEREFIRSATDHFIQIAHIINISSTYAHQVPKSSLHHFYAGSQSAAYRASLHFRQMLEFRDSCIKVTNIIPKLVKTSFYKNCVGEDFDKIVYQNNNSLQPEDIADAVEYVLMTPFHVQVRDIFIEAADKFD